MSKIESNSALVDPPQAVPSPDVEADDVQVIEEVANDSPVVRWVDLLLEDALANKASDIHIEPQEDRLRVRYRIDGVLFEAAEQEAEVAPAVVSRLKILANLDISERRLPQDGRIHIDRTDPPVDLRLSTLPTPFGEKVVMRILDERSIRVQLSELGMPQDTLHIWQKQIVQPHGILLVTGPTGSGKSTTLFASLGMMDCLSTNICTVEDPIEYRLPNITQVQTHERIGMTFASALRALLRQDPDVVMVGEIRDTDTAHIAVQAALTGHLVLSTLHTNDAPSSVTRLINIGIEPYLIGAAVNGVLAQRLVRRLCPHCAQSIEPDEETAMALEMHNLDPGGVKSAVGCDQCRGTGFFGRVGLYELLMIDDALRDMIARSPHVSEFRRICLERGMASLRMDGFSKVAAGQTTLDEVLRVTQATI